MSISTGKMELYSLWYEPGLHMYKSWWDILGLTSFRDIYFEHELTRSAIDLKIRKVYGALSRPPILSDVTVNLFVNEQRRNQLLISLGLWTLQGGDYLFVKAYREKLENIICAQTIKQLQFILPRSRISGEINPNSLLSVVQEKAMAWMFNDKDPALHILCLLYPPTDVEPPIAEILPVLKKISRMI